MIEVFLTISTLNELKKFVNLIENGNGNVQYFLRINGSHADLDWVKEVAGTLSRKNLLELLFYDIPFRKMRIRGIEEIGLKEGEEIVFSAFKERNTIFVQNLDEVFDDIEVRDILSVDDGRINFEVVKKVPGTKKVVLKSLSDGDIKNGMGVWFKEKMVPGTKKVFDDFKFLSDLGIKNFMLSFARDDDFLKGIQNRENFHFMAKIEDRLGYENLEKLISSFDSICVARGDLGASLNFPEWVKMCDDIVLECVSRKRKVFLAGETFMSTIYKGFPSRAELSDFYHYLEMGIDGIVLSDESVYGKDIFKFLKFLEEIVKFYERKKD